ncbi:hypothetical protein ACIBH1_44045 [Nonomuraea sp. NPDC050663]|uniref:hypothetical protein n=1 Tax=Nonomuraea sp. NPDC050663 TaxID=3364370 RepID=UPI0017ACDC95|nr:hypothetical protein [Thermoactinospora sp.]
MSITEALPQSAVPDLTEVALAEVLQDDIDEILRRIAPQTVERLDITAFNSSI